jgi:hypothetical protein
MSIGAGSDWADSFPKAEPENKGASPDVTAGYRSEVTYAAVCGFIVCFAPSAM